MNILENHLVEQARKNLTKLIAIDPGKTAAERPKSVESTFDFATTSAKLVALTDLADDANSGLCDAAVQALREISDQYLERYVFVEEVDDDGIPFDEVPLMIYADSFLPMLGTVHALEDKREILGVDRGEDSQKVQAELLGAYAALAAEVSNVVDTERNAQHRRIMGH